MDSFLDPSKDRSPENPAGEPAGEDAAGRVPPAEQNQQAEGGPEAQAIGEHAAEPSAEAEGEQNAASDDEQAGDDGQTVEAEPDDEPETESQYALEDEFGDETGSGRRQKVVFCLTIGVICSALIALIWVATLHAIGDQRADTMARGKAWVEAQANLLTESARRELTTIDQSLVMLEAAYRVDPQHFNLRKWQRTMPGLNRLVKEFFIANPQDVIVQDTLPQAVGQGIGGAYASFDRGALQHIAMTGQASPNTRMLLGEVNKQGAVRQYLMSLLSGRIRTNRR